MAIIPTSEDVVAGQKSYNPATLKFYDLTVYGFTCPVLWKVPRRELLGLYDRNISAEHLDIGVGSRFLLSKCAMPSADQRITLLDMNPHCLTHVKRRLSQYKVSTVQGNVLEPFPLPKRSHGSAALNLNRHDSLQDLRRELSSRFSDFTLTLHGCTALFEATVEE